MTNKIKTGGPAFPALPITRDLDGEMLYQAEGLTIRDYFAAKAMQALIQARATLNEEEHSDMSYENVATCGLNTTIDLGKEGGDKYTWLELLTEEAYECADSMLKARQDV
jgi:hypothetical protein